MSGSSTVTGASLLPDTYSLSETTVAGYVASAWSCTGATSFVGADVTLSSGDVATCTITNTYTGIVEVDLDIIKTVSDPTATVGETVTFTLCVENLSGATATNVTVNDVVPAGYSYAAATISGGDSNDDSDPAVAGLEWIINTLNVGDAPVCVSFDAVVNAP